MVMVKNDYYLGNPRLRKANTTVPMTSHQIEEFRKCKKDIIYFVENYMKIRHVDRGLIPFDLYDYQKELLLHLKDNRFSIVTTCRQAGKCVFEDETIKIRNKKTGEIKEIPIKEFHKLQKNTHS